MNIKDGYLIVNDTKIKLTSGQLAQLSLKNYFKREYDKTYYLIDSTGDIDSTIDVFHEYDNKRYDNGNYFPDVEMAKQYQIIETLNRLLWRYAVEHDCYVWNFNPPQTVFRIIYYHNTAHFTVEDSTFIETIPTVYFSDKTIAERAIQDVVIPFAKEHHIYGY